MEEKPILGYWDMRGIGGPIRALFTHLQVDFEDRQYGPTDDPEYTKQDWIDVKMTLGLDFPNLPYLIDGDVKLTNTTAILRYICKKWKLEYLGDSAATAGRADMYMEEASTAFWKFIMPLLTEGEAKRQEVTAISNGVLDTFVSFRGDHLFAADDVPTYVDFFMYEFLIKIKVFDPSLVASRPKVGEYLELVQGLHHVDTYEKEACNKLVVPGFAKWNGKVDWNN